MKSNIKRKMNLFGCFIIGVIFGVALELLLIKISQSRSKTGERQEPLEWSVTCVILVRGPHLKNVVAARKTWVHHCDEHLVVKLIKIRSQKVVNTCQRPETRNSSYKSCPRNSLNAFSEDNVINISAVNGWDFMCQTLFQINHNLNSKWIIFSPDNLFVLIENLKLLTRHYDHRDGYYIGHPVHHYTGHYNILNAGVVLSQGAFVRLLESLKEENCHVDGNYWNNEDVYLGSHLRFLNITPSDSRDEQGRIKFHSYNIHSLLTPGKLVKLSNYYKNSVYPMMEDENCCSQYSVTFDGTEADKILFYYYMLYKLKVYPNLRGNDVVLDADVEGEDLKRFLIREDMLVDGIEKMSQNDYYNYWSVKLMPPEEFYQKLRKDIVNV